MYSGSWWWTGWPGMLRFMGSHRVGHNWATELNWTEPRANTFAGSQITWEKITQLFMKSFNRNSSESDLFWKEDGQIPSQFKGYTLIYRCLLCVHKKRNFNQIWMIKYNKYNNKFKVWYFRQMAFRLFFYARPSLSKLGQRKLIYFSYYPFQYSQIRYRWNLNIKFDSEID